ncbi:transcriptional regulator, ArsR family [Pseudoalteromonas sp. SW0106-04]|uniref:ArsR/SmtB family transcription factor n=1 Tax=Pseudoalteromonas sp. SW0106-04 TaxID=1702169 RepID=UPI0006B48438|nr:metalloregulator ArsR/SmtB family transcription factor [Pseudoalteromonas sp. SW0106-04]GAP76829.1 transcriptional regulator, ArsR family [Pseudoalteromonas sp. SW0106-04]
MDFSKIADSAEQAQSLLKILANKNRLMILCSLQQGELSVSQLNDAVPLSQSALSQHLAVLRNENMVTTRRESQTIYYQLCDDNAKAILQTLYMLFCQE